MPETSLMTIQLPARLRERLTELAVDQDESPSTLVHRAVEAYVAKETGWLSSDCPDRHELVDVFARWIRAS